MKVENQAGVRVADPKDQTGAGPPQSAALAITEILANRLKAAGQRGVVSGPDRRQRHPGRNLVETQVAQVFELTAAGRNRFAQFAQKPLGHGRNLTDGLSLLT